MHLRNPAVNRQAFNEYDFAANSVTEKVIKNKEPEEETARMLP